MNSNKNTRAKAPAPTLQAGLHPSGYFCSFCQDALTPGLKPGVLSQRNRLFIQIVKDTYQNLRSFPWRDTTDPYAILVSEIMLQQTQTHRVVPKYMNWLSLFPTVQLLTGASLADVLTAWSGLGYNRRGKYLWEAAKIMVSEFEGEVPKTYEQLRTLPGVGEYTANAVLAFAYNLPTVVLETNIRTALLHHFFLEATNEVSDQQLKEILADVIDQKDPRNWYYALMDYGAWLKSEGHDYFHKQKQHTKQKPLKGSERYVRGFLLREVLNSEELKLTEVVVPGYTTEQIMKVAKDLSNEGLVKLTKTGILKVV